MTQPPESEKPEAREMYGEIAALIGAVAKALALKESDVIAAVESGALTLEFGTDANANRFVLARHGDQTARVYQGAIKRSDK